VTEGEASVRRGLLLDLRPLRESPAFRRLWVGGTLSAIGGRMSSFAVMLQVYRITHSSAAVGALGLALFVPLLAVGLFGGSFADAVDRRRLALATSTCQVVLSAALAAQAFAGLRQLWLLYGLVAAQSLVGAVGGPVRRTFVPRLLPPALVPAGVALNQLSFQASITAGPLLAGVLVAAGGLRACYLVDVVSFGAAFYGLVRLPAMRPEDGAAVRPGVRAVVEGLRFLRHQPVLAGAFLTDLNATVLGMPWALFPALNAAHFGGGARTLGLITAAPAVGGLVGTALSGPVGRVIRPGRAMLVTVAFWGGCITVFGLSRMLWLALLALALSGAADTISVVFRATLVQTVTPDHLRGRISGVDFVVGAGGPQLGNFEAGMVAAATTPTVSAVGGGLATILSMGALRLALPAFARYDSSTAAAPPADETSAA
jgi:MFS family permease